VDDIELFGLTYLQKISDVTTGGAVHIEPGIWIHIPSQDVGMGTSAKQSVARMGYVPHGNSLLAQGTATKLDPFTGNPFNPDSVAGVNTAPFPVGDAFPLPAPGTGVGMPVSGALAQFAPYDLSNLTPAAVNFRTPAGNTPAVALPAAILGVPMQDVILDPTKLLTAALSGQTISSMVTLNVATVATLLQQQAASGAGAPSSPKNILANFNGGGGVETFRSFRPTPMLRQCSRPFGSKRLKGRRSMRTSCSFNTSKPSS
jgi:hypothetical protein